ncbi:hypothetical protein DFR71_4573 [Nocardia alba]|uniref:Uncharacterized protein n=1 Tax=Nocardia alba TaxID=225051 RepID=A0A4R1FT39_9NOCA|nr:hypothetical protein DFR71_4573 [Nocardia alba]
MIQILKLQAETAKNDGEDAGWSTLSMANCTHGHEMQ